MALKKIKKAVGKQLRRAAKFEATRLRVGGRIVNYFVPGLGTVSAEVAKVYDKLSEPKKKKFHSAKTKAAKMRILKS